jgi:hypothetical protein
MGLGGGVSVPAGAVVVVVASCPGAGASDTVTDSQGNSYTLISTVAGYGSIFYSVLSTGLTGSPTFSRDSITYDATGIGGIALSAMSITGVAASSPLDAAVTARASGGSGSSPSVTSGTPSSAGEAMVAGLAYDSGATFTQDTTNGWSTPPARAVSTINDVAVGGSQVVAGAAAKTFAPTLSSGSNWAAWIIGFLPVQSQVPYTPTAQLGPIIAQ